MKCIMCGENEAELEIYSPNSDDDSMWDVCKTCDKYIEDSQMKSMKMYLDIKAKELGLEIPSSSKTSYPSQQDRNDKSILSEQDEKVVILCAGWKNKFSLEDSVFAGALVDYLLKKDNFYTICDSAIAAQDLWSIAKKDIHKYIDKAAQRSRLRRLGLDDVIEYGS